MFLECVKSGNTIYLYKSFYLTVAKGKYKRTRELIGTLDELSKLYDDPISHFREVLKEETLLEKQQKKDKILNLSINSSHFNSNDIINGTVIDNKFNKNFGSVILQFLYHQLDFEKLVKRIKYKENTKINISKLIQLLILCRCIYTNSKLSDFKNQNKFADTFNLSKDDIYRGLEILNKYKDDIISHLNNNIGKFVNYNFKNSHYDLTNYFVYTDNTTFLIQKIKNGKPIIQQALLVDANGLPINYKLFSGNRNDVSTLVEFLDDQKKKFNIKNTTIIADAGLVSNENIVKILLSKNQYIFKQSLLRVNKDILSTFNEIVKPKLEEVMKINEHLKGCFFSVVLDITVKVKDIKGNLVNVTIPQKYIFTYSKKYEDRQEQIRLDQLEDAQNYIKSYTNLKNTFKKHLPSLVKASINDVDLQIDEEKISKYEQTAGYSLIITSKINSSDKEIIEEYKNQYLIEESFRISKTDLNLDNIYLRKDNRIQGHFLIGFLSLAFLRILQISLAHEYSISKIQEELKEFTLEKIRQSNNYQISRYSILIAKIQQLYNVEINKQIYSGTDLINTIGNVKKIRKDVYLDSPKSK